MTVQPSLSPKLQPLFWYNGLDTGLAPSLYREGSIVNEGSADGELEVRKCLGLHHCLTFQHLTNLRSAQQSPPQGQEGRPSLPLSPSRFPPVSSL